MTGVDAPLVLASQSKARQAMLKNAGLKYKTIPASIEEDKITMQLLQKKSSPENIARELARQKALAVATENPRACVIGSDQILELDGKIFSKAKNPGEARDKLRALRGKTHRLISAVCVAAGAEMLWSHSEEARLTMHEFDDDFLESYCEKAGEALTHCVGAYEIEGVGAHLFSAVQGDHFTILGMPLLPLLGYLRKHQGISL